MKPEKMSPEVLRNTLKRLCLHVPEAHNAALRLETHIAALEQERDTAVADNAALLKIIIDAGEAMRKRRKPNARFVAISMVGDVPCDNGHPGAALLEEHRKALEQRDAAMRLSAMTQETVERLNARIDQDDREHAKALVRARNEGLEKAAALLDAERMGGAGCAMVLAHCAAAICAMKEPEK